MSICIFVSSSLESSSKDISPFILVIILFNKITPNSWESFWTIFPKLLSSSAIAAFICFNDSFFGFSDILINESIKGSLFSL